MMKSNIIMMIDDDPDTLRLYELSLKDTGFSSNFLTFESAHAAKEHLQACVGNEESAPDYIIIDLNMPDMSGFQFITLFEDEFYSEMPDTKVITITSSVRKKDKEEALKYNSVTDFISKPISKSNLLKLFEL